MIDRIVLTPANTAVAGATATTMVSTTNIDYVKSAIPVVEIPIFFFDAHGDVFVLTFGNFVFLLVSITSLVGVGISIFKSIRSKPKRST